MIQDLCMNVVIILASIPGRVFAFIKAKTRPGIEASDNTCHVVTSCKLESWLIESGMKFDLIASDPRPVNVVNNDAIMLLPAAN